MSIEETYLRPVRGMRDLLPEDYYPILKICEKLAKIAESYGYLRVETPALEHFEILKAKAGEEIINEIYYFKDKAGREVGLRFDLTVPIARIVAYRKDLPRPVRWYYISKVWRYDEPQHGRYREFHQYGIELIGWGSIQADAEGLEVLYRSLEAVELGDYEIRINDREIMDEILDRLRIERGDKRLKVFRILDKRGKISKDEMVKMLTDLDLSKEIAETLVNISEIRDKFEKAPEILRELKVPEEKIRKIEDLIIELEDRECISKMFIDLGIVRGLDYYTGLVYEVYVPDYNLAVGGGGRYDNLIEIYSGIHTPALGFAIGVERLVEALSLKGKIEKPKLGPDYYIYVFGGDRELARTGHRIARALRDRGARVIVERGERSLRAALEYASKIGARKFIIVGKREHSRGTVKVRDMEKWTEQEVKIEDIIEEQYI
ncbi:MAG: histidine--tRNA ligase [Crenarchaeota archaeon]|nr:histidine--tRNA ligase [Thermoproteota archaeon]